MRSQIQIYLKSGFMLSILLCIALRSIDRQDITTTNIRTIRNQFFSQKLKFVSKTIYFLMMIVILLVIVVEMNLGVSTFFTMLFCFSLFIEILQTPDSVLEILVGYVKVERIRGKHDQLEEILSEIHKRRNSISR